MENFRRAIGLRIKENKEVYEGEVVQMTPEETENPLGGYGKTISQVVIGLKTTKGVKTLKLDPAIYDSLQKEKVAVGDVIYIEASTGAVKRVGRCDAFATEFDLEAEEYVPLPKGDVHKKKEIVQDVRRRARARARRTAVVTRSPARTLPLTHHSPHTPHAAGHVTRLGRRKRAAAGRAGSFFSHGVSREAEEDGDHGEAALGDQQGCEPVH